MDFNKIVDKAKDWAGKNPDKANDYVDKGTQFAKGKFGNEGAVDSAGDKAKQYLTGGEGQQGQPGQGQPGQGEQPPPPRQ